MRYRDVITNDRFRLSPSHPIMVEIILDAADWCRFQQLAWNDPAVRILGHDDPQDGQMIVYTACASQETRRRLEDGWG